MVLQRALLQLLYVFKRLVYQYSPTINIELVIGDLMAMKNSTSAYSDNQFRIQLTFGKVRIFLNYPCQ